MYANVFTRLCRLQILPLEFAYFPIILQNVILKRAIRGWRVRKEREFIIKKRVKKRIIPLPGNIKLKHPK